MELVGIDCLGPLPESYKGNKYIITWTDHITKRVEDRSVPDITAITTADFIIQDIIWGH